jgi:hypothetical protein
MTRDGLKRIDIIDVDISILTALLQIKSAKNRRALNAAIPVEITGPNKRERNGGVSVYRTRP